MNKFIFTYVFVVFFLLSVVSVFGADGDPAKFGNSTTTTCTIGGTSGNISCSGNISAVKYYYTNGTELVSGSSDVVIRTVINNSGYYNITSFSDSLDFCPDGSAQVGNNATGRYCDTSLLNSSDNISTALVVADNVTTDIFHITNASGSIVGGLRSGTDNSYLYSISNFYAQGNIGSSGRMGSDGDIYTSGVTDNLWLGTSTESASNASINSSGFAYFNQSVTSPHFYYTNGTELVSGSGTGTISTINRSQVINNWAFCPAGSVQYGENETGRYCDATFINTSDVDQFYNSSEFAEFAGVNSTDNIYVNKNISFINSTGSLINAFYTTTSTSINVQGTLYAGGQLQSGAGIYSAGDIYTTGSGDDFWLGTSTQSSSLFRGYANGEFNIRNISFLNSSNSEVADIYVNDGSSTVSFSTSIYSSSNIYAQGNSYSAADIYTTGPGDDLWLGTSTQAASNASITAAGVALFNSSVATQRINLNTTSTYTYSNGSCIFTITPTANFTVGC